MNVIQCHVLTLDFVKKKIIDILKTHFLQSQAICDDKRISKKNLHIFEDNASDVQVGDIEQVIV